MSKTFQIGVHISTYGYLTIHVEDDETKEFIEALPEDELMGRIKDFHEIVDQIDDSDVDFEEVRELS